MRTRWRGSRGRRPFVLIRPYTYILADVRIWKSIFRICWHHTSICWGYIRICWLIYVNIRMCWLIYVHIRLCWLIYVHGQVRDANAVAWIEGKKTGSSFPGYFFRAKRKQLNRKQLKRKQIKRKQLKTFQQLSPESQGQNLAVTVLYVPYSLDSGLRTAP